MARNDQARLLKCLALVLAGLSAAALTYPLQAGGTKSDSKVKIKAAAGKTAGDGKQVVTLTLDISKGWHLYANPVQNEDLVNNQTVVQVFGKDKSAVQVAYPAGTLKEDKVVGSYKIYEGTIQIPVTVKREAGDSGPLEFDVRINACDKSKCLQPSTVRVKVE